MSVPLLIAALMAASSGGRGVIIALNNHTLSHSSSVNFRLLGTGEAQHSEGASSYVTYGDEWHNLAPGADSADYDWKWVSLGNDPNIKPSVGSGVWRSFTLEDPVWGSTTGPGLRTDQYEVHIGLAGTSTTLVSATITHNLAGTA